MVFTKRRTNWQITLIKLFEYQIEDRQLLEIKDILAKYFAAEAISKETFKNCLFKINTKKVLNFTYQN